MTMGTGGCLCGEVTFSVRDLARDYGACHCRMCQRWAGAAMQNVTVPEDTITFEGIDAVATYQSSNWAERAWCTKCGSGIWYRVTADSEHSGAYHIPVGLFDDPSGFELKRQFFTDAVRAGYSFANDTQDLTQAEVWAKYTPDNQGGSA